MDCGLEDLPLPSEPLGEDGGVWLDQDPSPVVLQLKEQGVRVRLKVVCPRLDEEAIFQL